MVVGGTLPINNFNMLVLFELGATHLFSTSRIVTKMERGFIMGTPTGNRVWNTGKPINTKKKIF